jgi:hypothetical protein
MRHAGRKLDEWDNKPSAADYNSLEIKFSAMDGKVE